MERKTQFIVAGSLITLIFILGGVFFLIRRQMSEFHLHKEKVSWLQAVSESIRANHEIVTLKSKQEADKLAKFLESQNITQVWTGAAYLGNNNNYKYLIAFPSGTNVTYVPWFIKEDHTEDHHGNLAQRFCILAERLTSPEAIKRNNNTMVIKEEDCKTFKLPYVYI